jgi:integrase
MSTEKSPERKAKGTRSARGAGSVCFKASKKCWVWRAVVGFKPDGTLQYKEGRTKTQREAIQAKAKAEKGQLQPNGDKETVGDHLDHWLTNIAKPNTRPGTWARYEIVVRKHLKPQIGGTPLRRLTVSRVTKLWADLSNEGMSAGTVKKCSEVLATALEAAVSEEKIPVAPTANAVKPRVIRPEIEVFTDEEIKAIIVASDGNRLETLYKVAIGTGAREGELLCPERDDFDLAEGSIRITKTIDETKGVTTIVPPKSKAGTRTVSLPGFAFDAAKKLLKGRETGPVFPTSTGTLLQRSNFIRQDWTPLLEKAKVPYRKFHTLRHTHASRLLSACIDPAEVARRIGDKIETLMRVYAHWMKPNSDTAARVDAIYGEQPKPAPTSFTAKVKAEKL